MVTSLRARSRQRIFRPALARRVAAALEEGSVLLIAEAGFGKTMAIEEALAGGSHTAVWVRCTPADADPSRFVLDIVGAIRRALPGAADVLGEALAAATAPIDAPAACRGLLDDLEHLLVEPFVLVVDDAEQLAQSAGSLELVQLLLAGAGSGGRLRVAVATRRQLALRLAKLSAAGEVTTLGPAELAFDASECATLLEQRRGRPPPDSDVTAVMETTEGWPLGIALAALAAPGQEQLAARRSRADVFAFLAEEVVEQLPAEERAALIDSSLVRELSAEMVEALGLPPDFLATAERRGLFLRAVDPERRRFRYHPLFREHLLGRFAAERSAGAAQALHARAAARLDEAGEHGEAIEHWLAAGDHGAALEAMVTDREALLRGSRESLAGALAAMPAAVREQAGAHLLEGLLHSSAGRPRDAVLPLTRAVAGFRSEHRPQLEWTTRLVLADAAYSAGQLDLVVKAADGFDDPSARVAKELAPIVAMYGAQALADLGRQAESVALARRALAHPDGAHASPLEHQRAMLWEDLPAGRFASALAHARASVAELEDSGLPVELSTALAFLAAVHLEAGDDESALAAYERALRVAEQSGVAGYMADEMRWSRAYVFAYTGRIAEAERELAGAAPEVRSITGAWRVEIVRAMLALQRGDADCAVAAADRTLAALPDGALWPRLRAPAVLVPLLARAGCPDQAGEVLAEAMALCDERFPGGLGSFYAARLLAVRAWLRNAAGDSAGAAADLREAWEAAGDAIPQVLRCQWRELQELVWEALDAGALDPRSVIGAIERGWPGGEALVAFMSHPAPEVRRLAIASAAASGHPDALIRLPELELDDDPDVAQAARTTAGRLRREPLPLAYVVLGGFEVRRGSWQVPEAAFGRPIAARALRFMVVHQGILLPEDALFEAFWPDKSASAARRNLAVTLSLIRRVVDPLAAERSVIETTDRAYRLVLRERDSVDSDRFERAAAAALAATGPAARPLLEHAERLWTGEPLPEDRYAQWSAAWREELVDRYLELLGALARHYGASEDHADAIRTARKCVQIDPLNETWQRELIAAYARAGRTSHALRQYLECRRAIVDALGVEPAAETSRLQARILAGEPV